MFEYFTEKAIAVIMSAQQEARRLGHSFVGTEQILLGLLGEGSSDAAHLLNDMGLDLERTRQEVEAIIGRGMGAPTIEVPLTPKTKRVLERAFKKAGDSNSTAVTPEHLLFAITESGDSVAIQVLTALDVSPEELREKLLKGGTDEAPATVFAGSDRLPTQAPFGGSRNRSVLDEFGVDLTARAAQGQLDPVVGRDLETSRVIQILGRRRKNNPILIGEPGVGKTAIAEGLALRIVNHDVPESLSEKRVINLNLSLLVSGARYRGDFEERLKQIVEEVSQAGNIILVIDEVHTLVGGGAMEGGMDAANLLKPALARGVLQCVGATTLDEYRKHIEKDAALERRFQPVKVEPASVEDSIAILRGLRQRYEEHHQLSISDEALEAAAVFGDRYIMDRHLPDKAIDLMDEAGSRVRLRHSKNSPSREFRLKLRQIQQDRKEAVALQNFDLAREKRDEEIALEQQLQELRQSPTQPLDQSPDQSTSSEPSQKSAPIVSEEDIAQVVAAWTGIPVNRLTESESAMLVHLEDVLHERVIGQNEAVMAVAKAVRRARVGLKSPARPIASLMFSGPTGVGKTELAKALAQSVFGSEEAMIRLDMSEYMERSSVSKLTGSPPGYVGFDEGGQLTEAVRRRPYSVILLDEIEKAHPDVFNLLLQVLEDGRLTDSKGRVVSFKNTLLIMTSNIGSRVIEKGGSGLGFEFSEATQEDAQYYRIRSLVQEEMKQHFRPELINRMDEIIVFRQLNREEVVQIADVQMRQLNLRLVEQGIAIAMTEAFKQHLVNEGFDPQYGARPLRRAISRLIEDTLAEALLDGSVESGDRVVFDLDDDGQVQIQTADLPVLVEAMQG
ncbi:MAG: ATP-dependent Clp protease ATP-binding subunit [Elainellaceae cyanobacterium]